MGSHLVLCVTRRGNIPFLFVLSYSYVNCYFNQITSFDEDQFYDIGQVVVSSTMS
jgi:hypothetical protein